MCFSVFYHPCVHPWTLWLISYIIYAGVYFKPLIYRLTFHPFFIFTIYLLTHVDHFVCRRSPIWIFTDCILTGILKEINPEYSLEGLMLKLKLQYFDHLMQRADSLEKTLMLGKIESRRRGQQRMRWLDSITNSMDMNLSKRGDSVGQGSLSCCNSWGHKESDTT